MSQESSQEPRFEDQFRFCVREEGPSLSCPRDSYSWDLLGFDGAIPMLSASPSVTPQSPESRISPATVSPVSLEPDQSSINESQPQAKTPSPQQPVKALTGLALQGKRVIIRTNSMSGQKSLIFKQKTGGNVEIPAKLSSFLKATEIKQEVPSQLAKQVHPSNVAHVVFPKHKPPILKRPVLKSVKDFCDAVNSEVKSTNLVVKVEDKDIFEEDVVDEAKPLPFDHDYFSAPSRGVGFCPENGPPPLVKISAPRPRDEVIEVPDDDDDNWDYEEEIPAQVVANRTVIREITPVKLSQQTQFSEANFDRFQAQKMQEGKLQQSKRSEEKQGGKQLSEDNKTDQHLTIKPPPSGANYEIVNTNFLRKGRDRTENKNHFVVMYTNKETTTDPTKGKEPTKGYKPTVTVIDPKITPPHFKIPFRQRFKSHKMTQTVSMCTTRSVETNTDDFLLDELIERKVRMRALHNKVSKTTNTEEPLAPRHNLEDRITITPSPLLLGCDPSDILDLLDGPNGHMVGDSMDFATGPTVGQVHPSFAGKSMGNTPTNGKVIDNCGSITDISYSRGKNICNGWGAPETLPNPTNGWAAGLSEYTRRPGPRVESWKLQLFLDLKNCDQFDATGNMPLHNAVIQNNVNLVKRQCLALRTRQVDINTLNHSTNTALQLALLHDVNVHIVQLLLQYDADTSVLDPEGNNVLHICVSNSSESVMKLLLSSTVCADINGTNFEGYTPLIMCALYQKYVQADDLLSTGADPNIADKKSGRTPLFHAVEANDVEMVKLLLNHRAQPKVKNFFGTSPHDAMFELDTINPQIRSLILNKDEGSSKPSATEVKGRRKRKPDQDKTYSMRPYGPKSARTKVSRS